MKLSINWVSNSPWSPSGYGNQTKLFTSRLQKEGYPINITAIWGLEGGGLNYDGIPVYPKGWEKYSQDVVEANSIFTKSDVAISLMDAWVCEPNLFRNTKWIPWFPIDSEPASKINLDKVAKAYKRIVISKHGAKMMDAVGMDYTYIPHGVDTNKFYPMDMNKAREYCKLPKDIFIVGMVAANKGFPPRKAFAENIAGFMAFKKNHKDALLYIHSTDGSKGEGFNIHEYCKLLGLKVGEDYMLTNQYQMYLGLGDEQMNALYNSFDVHLLCSKGEGFGIPILEAQAAGCPVIVGDWTSMGELCFSGWKLDKLTEARPEFTQYGAFWFVPNIEAIADRLEKAYEVKGNIEYRNRARKGALRYDADKLVEKYWIPFLDEIYADLHNPDKHIHQWATVGLFNADKTISLPCIGCDDELKGNEVIKDGFKYDLVKIVSEPKDGISKIVMREIVQDYQLDGLNIGDGKIIEIGSHIGVVTNYLAKQYPEATVIGYEPNPKNYEHLLLNIEANECKNIIVTNKAVTKDGRRVCISTVAENSGGGDIYSDQGDIVESVMAERLFDKPVALLKIDCEGAEYEIFEALTDEQISNIGAIRGEFHSNGNARQLLERLLVLVPDTKVSING